MQQIARLIAVSPFDGAKTSLHDRRYTQSGARPVYVPAIACRRVRSGRASA